MSATYQALYDNMEILPSKQSQVETLVGKIYSKKARYQVVESATGVPWYVIAAIHYRESSCSFTRHQHNGDPLTARTVHVPAGRPKTGNPPFTWEQSAIDALKMQGLHKVTDWSMGNTLDLLEKYNGLGYKKKGLPSPYIWSWTNNYKSGKYVADGKFDPNAIDGQCGVAVILKALTT